MYGEDRTMAAQYESMLTVLCTVDSYVLNTPDEHLFAHCLINEKSICFDADERVAHISFEW
jgi:hypothetical protein